MAEPKEATRVITLEDIKYNEENKVMAILSLFGWLGLILALVEKDDLFVKYHGFQFGLASIPLLVSFIPCIGWILPFVYLVFFVMGLMKVLKGERYDMPMVSGIALNLLNK